MISDYEILFRLVLAAVLGAAVGFEREVHGRPAGIRTYLLLCMGSALIMVVSEFLFLKFENRVAGDILRADPARIAAQAITGIGFLGAGVILRYRDTIRGLTTAASVWVACAVGLAIGAGFYLFGTVVTIITLVSLVGIKTLDRHLRKDWYKEMTVVAKDDDGQFKRIQEVIARNNIEIVNFGLKKDVARGEVKVSLLIRMRAIRPSREVLQEVFSLDGVKSVDLNFL